MITIKSEDIQGGFVTPPRYQGQLVNYDYACTMEYILERRTDRTEEPSETITAYEWGEGYESFEPQNDVPKLGREVGPAQIV